MVLLIGANEFAIVIPIQRILLLRGDFQQCIGLGDPSNGIVLSNGSGLSGGRHTSLGGGNRAMNCICLQRFVVRLHALALPTFVIFPVVLMGVVGKSVAKNDRITCTNADVGELLGYLGRCGIDDFHRIMGSATGGRLFGFEFYKLGVLALAFDREKLRGIGDDRAIHTPGVIGEYGGILRFQA